MGSNTASSHLMTREWPHLKGTQADYAKVEIGNDRPDVQVHVVPKVFERFYVASYVVHVTDVISSIISRRYVTMRNVGCNGYYGLP